MCGIAGIVKLNPQEMAEDVRLKCMRDVLIHRGPDDAGLWIEGPVGLGHRRLAIVDVAGGHQPMSNEACAEHGRRTCPEHGRRKGTVWITYNGEIYNHAALRSELERCGHIYRTHSDTETILHLYEEDGDRCVERLQGMFAFALWDRARKRLLLARDRIGIKPLYYACSHRELLFASEIKAILAALPSLPEFNTAVLPEFLATGFVSGAETFFRGVRKLLPGRILTWSPDDGLREHRYWQLPADMNGHGSSLDACAQGVRERLRETVRSHLMSDVPLGLFLSGGIDSSGLAALMAPLLKERVRTFSVGFSDPEANELAYARLVACSVGAEHREVVVSPQKFFDTLPRLIWHEDEPIPFPSSIPLYFVSRLAREHVKVVLTGEGADELFLGYNRYRVTAWNERLGRTYWALTPGVVRRKVIRLVRDAPRPVRRYAERTFLALDPGPRELFYENFAFFPQRLQRCLLKSSELLEARDPYAEGLRYFDEASGPWPQRMSRADLQTYLVELLMKQDQMSMAASIESRVPYLDHEFVEHVVAIPGGFKLRGWETKAVLREALRDLVPREILTRRKMGFPVPVGRWLRGPFWPLVEQLLLGPRAAERGLFESSLVRRLAEEHRAGVQEHGDRLWILLNLEIWQRIFVDGEDVAGIMQRACERSVETAALGGVVFEGHVRKSLSGQRL